MIKELQQLSAAIKREYPNVLRQIFQNALMASWEDVENIRTDLDTCSLLNNFLLEMLALSVKVYLTPMSPDFLKSV